MEPALLNSLMKTVCDGGLLLLLALVLCWAFVVLFLGVIGHLVLCCFIWRESSFKAVAEPYWNCVLGAVMLPTLPIAYSSK
jgi:hypothetical protein